MDTKALRPSVLLAAWLCAWCLSGPARAGEEAKPAAPDEAAAEALKPFDNPKRIDLEGQGLALNEVLTKLEAHFGWKLSPSAVDLAKHKVDLAIKGATCFEALDAVRRAAKLGYADAHSQDAKILPLALCELGEKGTCLAMAKGPFLFRISQVALQTTQEVPLGQASGERQTIRSVTVAICAEPGLKVEQPSLKEAYVAFGQGEKQEVQAWLHQFGLHIPGAARTYTPSFSGTKNAPGPMALGGKLVVQVIQSIERRIIEDLDAQIGKAIDLGSGSLEFKRYIDSEGQVTVPFTAKGAATGMVIASHSSSMRMMGLLGGAVGGGRLEDNVPKDQMGLFFFDANRDLIPNRGMGYSGGADENVLDCNQRLPVRPKGVILHWVGKQAERVVAFEIAGVPEP